MPAAVAASFAAICALETFACLPFLWSALAGAAIRSAPAQRISVRLMHLGTRFLARGWRVELVEPSKDVHGLRAQPTVQRAPVGLGELAGAVVELRVADLAVLRVARGRELGGGGALARLVRVPPPQRGGDQQHHQGEHDEDDEQV